MTRPDDDRTVEQPVVETPSVSTAPPPSRPLGWWSSIPSHLGRARTSTAVMAVLFLAVGALYFNVRPDPVTPATTGGTAETTAPARTTAPPNTTAPETTAPLPTTEQAPTTTSSGPLPTTSGQPPTSTTSEAPLPSEPPPTTGGPDPTAGPTTVSPPG